MRSQWILAVTLLVGCAAQPGVRPDADDAVEKQEALVGARCADDASSSERGFFTMASASGGRLASMNRSCSTYVP